MAFEDADAVAEVLTWLRQHPAAAAYLGDPPSISGELEPPWPHLIVTEGTGGDLREMQYGHEQEVEFQLVSHPTGAPGKAALRKAIVALMRAVTELPERDVTLASQAVVSRVKPSGTLHYDKLSTGQLQYTGSLSVTIRPGQTP